MKAMVPTKRKGTPLILTATALGTGALLCFGTWAPPTAAQGQLKSPQAAPDSAAVQKILDKYRAIRPSTADLAVFQLDWTPGLKEAKEKAAKEQLPILLIVVTNSYGNMYT